MFITDEASPADEHWIDRLLRFGSQTPPSVAVPNPPADSRSNLQWAPSLHVLDPERTRCDEWLRANGWAGRPLILIQPGNFRSMSSSRDRQDRMAADDKAWPVQRWAALFDLVHQRIPEALIMLCGASREGPMLRRVQAAVGQPWVEVAELSLRELFALCESAHSMISIDTGPAHAAAALDVPLVVLYGAEPPARWLPRSGSGSPVVSVGGPPTSMRVDEITVEQVFNSWEAITRQSQPPDIERRKVVV
jgi:ADP-heptose:LPS heptosyltransferase